MKAQVKFVNFEEIESRMKQIPVRAAKKGLNQAVREAAKSIALEARRRAPVRSPSIRRADRPGRLKRAITWFSLTRRRKRYSATAGVGVKSAKRFGDKAAFYWHMVEWGTVKWAGQKFMTPAFESKKVEAVGVMRKKLIEAVDASILEVRRGRK